MNKLKKFSLYSLVALCVYYPSGTLAIEYGLFGSPKVEEGNKDKNYIESSQGNRYVNEEIRYDSSDNDDKYQNEKFGKFENKVDTNLDLSNLKTINVVSDLGFDNTGVEDISLKLKEVINKNKNNNLDLYFPSGEYKLSPSKVKDMQFSGLTGLILRGDKGSSKINIINPPKSSESRNFYALNLGFKEKGTGFKLEGINFDGSQNEQDLFFVNMSKEDYNRGLPFGEYESRIKYKQTRLTKGIKVNSDKVKISNSNFSNMYGGEVLRASDFEDVDIKDVNMENVGGADVDGETGYIVVFEDNKNIDKDINIDGLNINAKINKYNENNLSESGIVFASSKIPESEVYGKNKLRVSNSSIKNVESAFYFNYLFNSFDSKFSKLETESGVFIVEADVKNKVKVNDSRIKISSKGFNSYFSGLLYREIRMPNNFSHDDLKMHVYNSKIYLNDDAKKMKSYKVPFIQLSKDIGRISYEDRNELNQDLYLNNVGIKNISKNKNNVFKEFR